MSDDAPRLTDPSKEIAELGHLFLSSPPGKGTLVVDGLANCVGLKANDPNLLEVLAVINRRLQGLQRLARGLDDLEFDSSFKREIIEATDAFMQLLTHKLAGAIWEDTRKRLLSESHVTAFRWFSATAIKHRPLRLISSDDRAELSAQIVEAIEIINEDTSLEPWMRPLLIEGLDRLIFVLRYFPFFGHEAAISDLVLIHQKTLPLLDVIQRQPANNSAGVWKFLAILSMAGSLFILPDQGVSAIQRYQGWTQKALERLVSLSSSGPEQMRLLSPPAAILPRENAEVDEE